MTNHRDPQLFLFAAEFQSRDQYLPKLFCTSDELDYLVGKYEFPKDRWIECGLNGCTTLHGNGYVYAKKTGEESHCGVDCGKSHFEFNWSEVVARFQIDQKTSDRRRFLREIQANADDIKRYADDYDAACVTACRQINELLERFFIPAPELYQRLQRCAKNSGKIEVSNFSGRDLRRDLGLGGAQRANVEEIGTILGTSVLDARLTILGDLRTAVRPTNVLLTKNLETMSEDELAYHSKKFQSVRETLQATGIFISDARRFMRLRNLQEMQKLRQLFRSTQGGKVAASLDELDKYILTAASDPLNPLLSKL